MESNLIFLGNSQTFLGVISTIIILFIIKDSDGNFLFRIISDIKNNIVVKISKSKPEISFESFKQEPSYKSVLLYSKWISNDDSLDELKKECAALCLKVDIEKMQFQTKLTNWDEDVKSFAQIILDKDELQMSPMFIFAYSMVTFVVDELLRCSYISCNALILSSFYMLTIYVFLFWTWKWTSFMFKDDNIIKTSDLVNNNRVYTDKFWIYLFSGTITRFVIFICGLLILMRIIGDIGNINVSVKFWIILFTIFCCSTIYSLMSFKNNVGKDVGEIYIRYVSLFVSMLITSISCSTLIYESYPELFIFAHLQADITIFYVKFVSLFIILFFGLVFPFFLPLLRYLFMYAKAEGKRIWYRVYVFIVMRRLKTSFEKQSKRIPV